MYTALDVLIEDYNSLRARTINAIESLIKEDDCIGVKLNYDNFCLPDHLLNGSMNFIMFDEEGALICKESITGEKWFYLSSIGIDDLIDILEGLMKQFKKIKE